uniref:Putative ovule protein n=1 Tax=Solanum chacoense TaxID=4108 RepID=A0A0V0I7W0_SOLCH
MVRAEPDNNNSMPSVILWGLGRVVCTQTLLLSREGRGRFQRSMAQVKHSKAGMKREYSSEETMMKIMEKKTTTIEANERSLIAQSAAPSDC